MNMRMKVVTIYAKRSGWLHQLYEGYTARTRKRWTEDDLSISRSFGSGSHAQLEQQYKRPQAREVYGTNVFIHQNGYVSEG